LLSQILEIPDAVYSALVQAAKARGATPVEWIAAHLPALRNLPDAAEPPEQQALEDLDALAEARPWRGSYAPAMVRPVLFTQELAIQTTDLPRWKPTIAMSRRSTEADDE